MRTSYSTSSMRLEVYFTPSYDLRQAESGNRCVGAERGMERVGDSQPSAVGRYIFNCTPACELPIDRKISPTTAGRATTAG